MNTKVVKTSEIRLDLENIFGAISDPTWAKMRSVLQVDGHWVSEAKALGFWAYAAIRRENSTVQITKEMIIEFVRSNGDEPRRWFPFFISTATMALPSEINGDELARYFKQSLGWSVSLKSIDRYCVAVTGRKAKVSEIFTASQVRGIIWHRCRLAMNRTEKQVENGKRLANYRKAVA